MQPRRLVSRFICWIVALCWPALLSGQAPLTPVFQVNATSLQYQAPSAVAIDDRGRALVDYRDTAGFPLEQTGRFVEVDSTLSLDFELTRENLSSGNESLGVSGTQLNASALPVGVEYEIRGPWGETE